jgi:small subunit ribosomal protein S6
LDTYELIVLLHPDLEIDLDKPLKKIEKLIKDQKGTIVNVDNWGKRKLAYPISKQEYAIYVYYDIDLPKDNVNKLDAILNITDESIRHLIVKHVEPPEEDKADDDEPKKDKPSVEEEE